MRQIAMQPLQKKPLTTRKFLSHVIIAVMAVIVTVVPPASAADQGYDNANNILFYDPDAANCGLNETNNQVLNGNDNLQKIYNFFLGKGLSDVQAAGVVGNIAHESGGYPARLQGHPENETFLDPSNITSGWGLIQWTPGKKVLDIAKQANITTPIYTLETQLNLVWWHMTNTSPTGVKDFLKEYKTTTSVEQATTLYEQKMEGAGIPALPDRIAAAKIAMGYAQNPSSSTDVTTGCSCPTGGSGAASTVDVVLDPGHSGQDRQGKEVDANKLYVGDSSNPDERQHVWDTAVKVKSILESKGYTVKMTKSAEDSYVNLADRAKIANDANAQIAVSIHSTPGNFGSASVGWVIPQQVGEYRTATNGRKITFTDSQVAAKSQAYAEKILTARKNAEGDAQIHALNFDGRAGLSPGNISIVQLESKVPWVYNEVGQSFYNGSTYAQGIANGIMATIQPSSKSSSVNTQGACSTAGAAAGNAVQTAINYAWPDYHAAPYLTAKPVYTAAVNAAIKKGLYVGGLNHPGIDCGGFVTRVMQDSGVDPNYNKDKGNTVTQEAYMRSSGKYVQIHPKTTADMQPGDIAINSDHTYMYVGKQPGFNSVIASASVSFTGQGWRAPMAGREQPADPNYDWYRLKS